MFYVITSAKCQCAAELNFRTNHEKVIYHFYDYCGS